MPVTSPSKEAQDAIVDILNETEFSVQFEATASDVATTALTDGEWLSVDVVADDEEEALYEVLDLEDRTRHKIMVQLTARTKPDGLQSTESLKLLAKEIAESLEGWDSDDDRVRVWFINREPNSPADKDSLRSLGLFRRNIVLEVEVEP